MQDIAPRLVYIAHQIGGAVDENVKDVLRLCREIHTPEIIPFAPYLVQLQYLDDCVAAERALGMQANKELFRRRVMDEVWLTGPRISGGMTDEIHLSLDFGIPIVAYNTALLPKLDELIAAYHS